MEYEISEERGFSDFFCCLHLTGPSFSPHVHSHIEFVYVRQGTLSVHIGQNTYALEPDTAIMILPYEIHSYTGDASVVAFILACPLEYLPEHRQILTSHSFDPPFIKTQAVHRTIITDIVANNCKDELKMKALLYCTLSEFLQTCRLEKKHKFEYDLYRKAIVYISEHYREPLTLEQTARHTGVSTAHLSRVLHADGKPGFPEILNSLRVHAAKTMLEQENLSVSEIALSAGFGSVRNFNRIFKKHFGCNPSHIKIPGSN